MVSMRQHLVDTGTLAGIALPPAIDALLTGLAIQDIQPDGTGNAAPGFTASPLFLDLSLTPPGPNLPFLLRTGEPDAAFRLWIELAATAPAKKLFDIAGALPDLALKPATVTVTDTATTLSPTDGSITITGATVALLVEGKPPAAAMRLVPTVGQPDGLVELLLARVAPDAPAGAAAQPSAAALGGSGFGIEAPRGIVIDQSQTASPPGAAPSWEGLAIPDIFFYLPAGVPVFGDSRAEGRLEIGTSPASGVAMTIVAKVPARDGWPGFDLRVECIDPAAGGLSGLVPTLVEAAMELPVDGHAEQVGGHGAIEFAAGRPLVARARFARDPTSADGATTLTVAIEGQGREGLISVDASKGTAAKLMVAAGAFATAIIADEGPPQNADGSGVAIHAVLLAALGASAFLKDSGRLVLHGVELVSEGRGVPLGGALRFRLDYSVDVMVKPIGIGSLSVEMKDEQPMRVRMREVVLGFDPARSGLAKLSLDFGHADMEVEDPGGWRVKGPESLFDILGTRSGRGSLWFEVDLAFRLDLGPVKVSGATLRATLVDGSPQVSIRGLDAALNVPGLLEAHGGFQVRQSGFSASLGASLVPLGANGLATLDVEQGDGTTMVLVNLDLDLPGPLPLGATGLALYGVGGTFGIFARPTDTPAEADPIAHLLAWKPDRSGFTPSSGALSIGLRVAVGTAPDMGFTFGAVGGVVVTVPDFALRGSISARMMSGRPRLVPIDQPIQTPSGIGITGAFLIDPAREVTFGLEGRYALRPLLSATIPVGGHFPVPDPANWYVNVGADGYPSPDRRSGPARLTILPDTPLSNNVRGYLMLRGSGLEKFPFDILRPNAGSDYEGFVVAFGFSLEWRIGIKPVLWAQIHGGVDVLVAVGPLVVAGRGWIGGALHAGPLSLGVDAMLNFELAPGRSAYVHARICGEIDLFLAKVRKCVKFGIGDPPPLELPPPDVHPLDRLEGEEIVGHGAALVDDAYRLVAPLATTPDVEPSAWPDAIVLLQFAIAPGAESADAPQFQGIVRPDQAAQNGSDRLRYWWTLKALRLYRIHDDGSEEEVAGPLKAAWQRGRFGDTAQAHEAAELALFTRDRQLFTQRLPDGGRSLPHDPIAEQGRICEMKVAPRPGWALGGPASLEEPDWHLPPDIVSPDRLRSRVEADARLPNVMVIRDDRLRSVLLHPFGILDLPPGIDIFPAGTEQFAEPSVTDPPFRGALWLDGGRRWQNRSIGDPQAFVSVRMNDTIHDGAVWLVTELDRIHAYRSLKIVFMADGKTAEERMADEIVPLTKGDGETRVAVLFRAQGAFDRLRIHFPMDARVGILGIGGVTEAARAWARRRNQEIAEEAAELAAAAGAGPQLDPVVAAGLRTILQPGALYRIDVDLRWGAAMTLPDRPPTLRDDQDRYAPRNGGSTSTGRQYYFRTFPVPQPVPSYSPAAVFDGRWRFLPFRDPFRPELLERHLAGYTPAQAEMDWFRDDPLAAHFGVGHVAALAHVYGYKLGLGLQRVDVPGEAGGLTMIASVLGSLARPGLLRDSGSRYLAEIVDASPCAQPRPGATLSAGVELAPRAWYEVHVALRSESEGIPDTRLAGVTFRTSRYRDLAELAAATGFGMETPGRHTGDVAIAVDPAGLAAGDIRGDDLAFEEMMGRLGMEGWPVAPEPRTSLLWRETPEGWRLGGVLIEAPEPLVRPGRCDVGPLTLDMGPAATAVFDVIRHDRLATRLLYLTRTPFRPQRWLTRGLTPAPARLQPTGGRLATPAGLKVLAATKAAVRLPGRGIAAIKVPGKVTGAIPGVIPGKVPGVTPGGQPPSGPLLPIRHDPLLTLAFDDFRHQPVRRTGTLILPLGPGFEGETA